MTDPVLFVGGGLAALLGAKALRSRWMLSRAKHPSLRGHAKWSQRFARLVRFYDYDDDRWFGVDDAPPDVQDARRQAFDRLSRHFRAKAPETLAASSGLDSTISDVDFVEHYRVPFQFREKVRRDLRLGNVVAATNGRRLMDLDGNESLDVTGGYGVNLLGYEVYKKCIARGVERANDLGPVLGPYHPVIADNVQRILRISGMDEVSFHMSGTEAVMQAVRLARYHTRKSHVVRFCGSYHGWWDGVQAGVGNPRPPHEVYTLADQSERSLAVLRTRDDIACVLVNPLQAMHPNGNAPSDSMLVDGQRMVGYDKDAYSQWLRRLREVCSSRGIALIFDEVFLGFRLAIGGAQEYFGVRADLVTYGKTIGGGLPIGVVCGRKEWTRRFRADVPPDVCFARGTFNSHPYVMTAMNEFLQCLEREDVRRGYQDVDALWNGRAARLNDRLEAEGLPIRVANMVSVWTTLFTQPSRYSWMFQYYLRAAGIATSWVGSGRFIFSHDFTDEDFGEFIEKFLQASRAMVADGWWWTASWLTSKWIRRRVAKEMLAAWFQRRGRGEARAVLGTREVAPVTRDSAPQLLERGSHARRSGSGQSVMGS